MEHVHNFMRNYGSIAGGAFAKRTQCSGIIGGSVEDLGERSYLVSLFSERTNTSYDATSLSALP